MLRKQEFYETEIWPRWFDEFAQSSDRAIFLHGTMGSELYDRTSQDTVWLDWGVWHEIDDLEYQGLTPEGSIDINSQFIYARSTVHPPVVSDPYTEILDQFKLGRFNYDWRESIPIEAKRLRRFLQIVPAVKRPINFITHSMGGCILLRLLSSTNEFDEKIGKIIFCAPPFHGSLKPIRVIEDGNGIPIDWLVRNSVLRQSAATMPGLFQLVVAPEEAWVTQIQSAGQVVANLQYPIRNAGSLYLTQAWTNKERLDIRGKLLEFANKYHLRKWRDISNVVERFKDRIHLIVGLNGKTTCCATRSETGEWVLHKVPAPSEDKISNGDGTVLFQSTLLPGLPTERYWAEIPDKQSNTHGGIVDRPNVIAGIRAILNGGSPEAAGLVHYDDFVSRIDWSSETENALDPERAENLDYIERARLRSVTPHAKWGNALNPDGLDAELFARTREAALQVLKGNDLKAEAERIGKHPEFLEEHIRTLLMPVLFV